MVWVQIFRKNVCDIFFAGFVILGSKSNRMDSICFYTFPKCVKHMIFILDQLIFFGATKKMHLHHRSPTSCYLSYLEIARSLVPQFDDYCGYVGTPDGSCRLQRRLTEWFSKTWFLFMHRKARSTNIQAYIYDTYIYIYICFFDIL